MKNIFIMLTLLCFFGNLTEAMVSRSGSSPNPIRRSTRIKEQHNKRRKLTSDVYQKINNKKGTATIATVPLEAPLGEKKINLTPCDSMHLVNKTNSQDKYSITLRNIMASTCLINYNSESTTYLPPNTARTFFIDNKKGNSFVVELILSQTIINNYNSNENDFQKLNFSILPVPKKNKWELISTQISNNQENTVYTAVTSSMELPLTDLLMQKNVRMNISI